VAKRFALYFKMYGMGEQAYLNFMSPGEIQEKRSRAVVDLSRSGVIKAGLGFWLTFGKNYQISPTSLPLFHERLKKLYTAIDCEEEIKRLDVVRISSQKNLSEDLPFLEAEETRSGWYLYRVRGA